MAKIDTLFIYDTLFMTKTAENHTLFMNLGWKSRPYRAAHTRIVNIWQYPPPPGF